MICTNHYCKSVIVALTKPEAIIMTDEHYPQPLRCSFRNNCSSSTSSYLCRHRITRAHYLGVIGRGTEWPDGRVLGTALEFAFHFKKIHKLEAPAVFFTRDKTFVRDALRFEANNRLSTDIIDNETTLVTNEKGASVFICLVDPGIIPLQAVNKIYLTLEMIRRVEIIKHNSLLVA